MEKRIKKLKKKIFKIILFQVGGMEGFSLNEDIKIGTQLSGEEQDSYTIKVASSILAVPTTCPLGGMVDT